MRSNVGILATITIASGATHTIPPKYGRGGDIQDADDDLCTGHVVFALDAPETAQFISEVVRGDRIVIEVYDNAARKPLGTMLDGYVTRVALSGERAQLRTARIEAESIFARMIEATGALPPGTRTLGEWTRLLLTQSGLESSRLTFEDDCSELPVTAVLTEGLRAITCLRLMAEDNGVQVFFHANGTLAMRRKGTASAEAPVVLTEDDLLSWTLERSD